MDVGEVGFPKELKRSSGGSSLNVLVMKNLISHVKLFGIQAEDMEYH